MTALATFSADGFRVTASNAVEYLAGTQAAGAGMVSANVRELATTMHCDLGRVAQQIGVQTAQLAEVNVQGFRSIGEKLQQGFGNLEILSGVSIAVQAAGFAVVAKQLGALRGDVRAMHADLARQGEELIGLQRIANAGIERLVDFAERQLKTQERILEVLVSSRTVEAQQLIRQGWENLKNGYEPEAFERFKRSLDFDNTVYVSHAELGRILEGRGDLVAAEDHLNRASRFASGAGPQVEGFALVQLAGFYERHGRIDDAITRMRDALRRDDMPPWRFYLCELLTSKGNAAEALQLLRALINADGRFHAVAAGSTALQTLQPKLTALLVELDAQRRGAAIGALAPLAGALTGLEALNSDAQTIETVRRNGATILEQSLVRPFVDLEPLGERALEAVQQARLRVEETCDHAVVEHQNLQASIAARISQTPPQKEPIQVGAVVANVQATAAFIVAGLAGCCGFGMLVSGSESERTGTLVVLILAVVALVVGLAFRSDQRSILAKHQQALQPLIEQWRQWRESAQTLVRQLEAGQADVISKVSAAHGHVRSPRVEAAIARVRAITPPRIPDPPRVDAVRDGSP